MKTAARVWDIPAYRLVDYERMEFRAVAYAISYRDRLELETSVGMKQCSCGVWFFPRNHHQLTCGHEKKV